MREGTLGGVRTLRFGRRGFGLGHLLGLLFLVRHPAFIVVLAVIVAAVWLYNRRRRR